jgi:threonine dehydrogenase-like Zn-dependent dehydrogenase
VPYADINLISIPPLNSTGPDGPRDIDYMLVGDIFATAWTVLNWSGFQAGDKVAVFGAGPVGLLTAYSALLRGASRVYSIDYVPQRLEKAASIGAIPINFKDNDPKDELARLEPDGVERSVDCVGFESVDRDLNRDSSIILRNMVNVTRYGGGIGVVGVYWTQPKTRGAPLANEISTQSLSIASAFMKALSYRGGIVDPRTVAPELIRLVASGKAKPGFVMSDTYSIEKGPEAYARFSNKEIIKPVLRFP